MAITAKGPAMTDELNPNYAELGELQGIDHEYMGHVIDLNFDTLLQNPAWYRLGEDLEEFVVEHNPDTESGKNILGHNWFRHKGWDPSAQVQQFFGRKDDPAFDVLMNKINKDEKGDSFKTNSLEIHFWKPVTGSATTFEAVRQECYVLPSSHGGDTGNISIPLEIHYTGKKEVGSFNTATKTYTAPTV